MPPVCVLLHSGPGARLGATAQPEEQDGEQTGEHWSEEDAHGSPAGVPGPGAGGRLVERR